MRKHGGTPSRRDKQVTPAAISPPGVARGRFVGGQQSGLAGCKPPPLFTRGASSCSSRGRRQGEPWGASPRPSAPTYLPFLCAPSSGGGVCCPCSPVCQHPGLSPPPPPPQTPCGHRPPASFLPQPTMSDRTTPSQDSPPPAPDTSLGGAIPRGPFPMFLMEITQSGDADRLLRQLDMLTDDALEVADTAIWATDPALADLCDALRWTAADGDIQAITPVTGAWTPRGLLLTATVTVAAGPSDTKVIENIPLSLVQGGPLLEYVSKDHEALTAALVTRWSASHVPIPVSRLRRHVFKGLYTATASIHRHCHSSRHPKLKGLPEDSQAHQPVPCSPPQAVVGPPLHQRDGCSLSGAAQGRACGPASGPYPDSRPRPADIRSSGMGLPHLPH